MQENGSFVYGPCNRNYAAVQGNIILDGCGEFMKDAAGRPNCAACKCHSSFHLVWNGETNANRGNAGHDRSRGDGGRGGARVGDNCSNGKAQPVVGDSNDLRKERPSVHDVNGKKGKKKYSNEELAKMRAFASSIGWTMTNKERDPEINRFCEKMGVARLAFRIWMNNNKRAPLFGTVIKVASVKLENTVSVSFYSL
ncbi:hypothetical protein F0562_032451 [Nyssa sinensis]|uniref:ZF-HD dimerization-type domain-containing protein n=1 Tax=Nyssa sinensis TaxID=561372 RepID=A0A5J5ATU9_9ASTE|nr:hypothetical protein F0562_032451 [Nyssa sinensis]